jgi:hypothetical protein
MRKVLFLLGGMVLSVAAGCNPPKSNGIGPENNNANANSTQHVGADPGAKTPPENVVTTSAAEVQLKPGGTADAKVSLAIADTYHVHANPATLKNLIATTLTVTAPPGFKIDTPVYPPGQTMKFSFDDKPLSVYAKTAEISVRVHADAKQAVGVVNVPAKLRYQACDDTACYPPKTIDVSIPVSVK